MSHKEVSDASSDTLTAEFVDGQLQIVSMTPQESASDELAPSGEVDPDYAHLQTNDEEAETDWNINNFTLVRCIGEDNEPIYKIVPKIPADEDDNVEERQPESAEDGNELESEQEGQDANDSTSYVIILNDTGDQDNDGSEEYVAMISDTDAEDTYVMVQDPGPGGTTMYLQWPPKEVEPRAASPPPLVPIKNRKITPVSPAKPIKVIVPIKEPSPTAFDLIKKAKAVNKAKKLLSDAFSSKKRKRPRLEQRIEPELTPDELLHSPNFKLYIYSCKLCAFRCNSLKELTKHKAENHSKKSREEAKLRMRNAAKHKTGGPFECAKCPFRTEIISELLEHFRDKNVHKKKSVENSESFVCQTCGLQTYSQQEFDEHMQEEEAATILST